METWTSPRTEQVLVTIPPSSQRRKSGGRMPRGGVRGAASAKDSDDEDTDGRGGKQKMSTAKALCRMSDVLEASKRTK